MQSKPEPFEQKAAQVEVDDAVSIASRDKGSHGDNVFGVIVLDSPRKRIRDAALYTIIHPFTFAA